MAVFLKNRYGSYLHCTRYRPVWRQTTTEKPTQTLWPCRREAESFVVLLTHQYIFFFFTLPARVASLIAFRLFYYSYYYSSKPQGLKSRLLLRTLVKKHQAELHLRKIIIIKIKETTLRNWHTWSALQIIHLKVDCLAFSLLGLEEEKKKKKEDTTSSL